MSTPIHQESSKPPGAIDVEPDGGVQAWLVVLSGMIINAIVFGNVHIWGIYQQFYLAHNTANDSAAGLSIIGSFACALVYAGAPFIGKAAQSYGARTVMLLGAILLPSGLFMASFSSEIWHLYATQGVMFGIGGSLVFIPSNPILAQWFRRRRALATGIAVSGVGIGGVLLAPFIEWLLRSFGQHWALRVNALCSLTLLLIAVLVTKERRAITATERGILPDLGFLRQVPVAILLAMGFVYAFGYVLPYYFLPTIIFSVGITASNAALIISIMSAVNALGRIILGFFADIYGRILTLFCACFVASLACFVLLPTITGLKSAIAFAVVYGFTAGTFWNLFPVVVAEFVRTEELQNANGVMYCTITVGQLIGPAIAASLLDITIFDIPYLLGELYTGLIFLISSAFGLWLLCRCGPRSCAEVKK